MKITRETKILVHPLNHETTFGEFVDDNIDGMTSTGGLTHLEVAEITSALANEGRYKGGGGAAGEFSLEVVERPVKATTWQAGEPPKDRPVVARGQVCWKDEHGGGIEPFIGIVQWKAANDNDDWAGWVDGSVMAVATDPSDKVVFFHWIDLPEGKS